MLRCPRSSWQAWGRGGGVSVANCHISEGMACFAPYMVLGNQFLHIWQAQILGRPLKEKEESSCDNSSIQLVNMTMPDFYDSEFLIHKCLLQ